MRTRNRSFPASIPRLRRGLVTVPVPRGLLVEGASRRHLFTGAAAASVLPRIFPLLDGSHDTEALCAELGLCRPDVEHVLDLLVSRGLLEAGGGVNPARPVSAQVTTYLSRIAGDSPDHPGSGDLLAELAAATVLIGAPRHVAEPTMTDLMESGVGTVTGHDADRLAVAAAGLSPDESPRLAVVFDDPGRPATLADSASAFGALGIPVLRCAAGSSWIEIGPLFHASYSACVECFRRGYAHAVLRGRDDAADRQLLPAASANMLAGLLVSEILALLASLGNAGSPRTLSRYSLSASVTERYLVTAEADCLRCHGNGTTPDPAPEEALHALDYEWQMEALPLPVIRPTPRRGAVRAAKPAPPRAMPTEPGLSQPKAHSPLPHRSLDDLPRVSGTLARVGGQTLADMLIRVGGADDGQASGNRQEQPFGTRAQDALELYALTGHDVFGLPGSVYRYERMTRRVYSVHQTQISLRQCLADTDLEPTGTALCLVFVYDVGDLVGVYGNFAYRLAHVQTGSAAARLCASTAGCELSVCFASRWPPSLGDLLDLRPGRQLVTALAGIRCCEGEPTWH